MDATIVGAKERKALTPVVVVNALVDINLAVPPASSSLSSSTASVDQHSPS